MPIPKQLSVLEQNLTPCQAAPPINVEALEASRARLQAIRNLGGWRVTRRTIGLPVISVH